MLYHVHTKTKYLFDAGVASQWVRLNRPESSQTCRWSDPSENIARMYDRTRQCIADKSAVTADTLKETVRESVQTAVCAEGRSGTMVTWFGMLVCIRAELDETGTRDTKTEAKLYFDGRICDALVEHSLQKCTRMFRTRAHSAFSSLPFLEEYIPNMIKTKDFCKVLNCPVHPLRIRQFQFGVSSLEDAENGIDIYYSVEIFYSLFPNTM